MDKQKIMKNLLILSFGFMLNLTGYFAVANMQSTINNEGNIGVISLSICYVAGIVFPLFLPNILIKKLGCKFTIILCILLFLPYIAANLYPKTWTLFPTAILLGAGGSTLWTATNTYINQLSFVDAEEDKDRATLSTSKFFGTFLMVLQTTQIWGNLVSFFVLGQTEVANYKNTSELFMEINSDFPSNISCGAEFCGGQNITMFSISDTKRYILVGSNICLSLISALVIAFFMDSIEKKPVEHAINKIEILSTLKQMMKVDQLLLSVITIFNGQMEGFVFGDYSAGYVACALGVENVGLVFVCYGIVSSITAFCSGFLLKYVPRPAIMTVAAFVQTGLLVALGVWKPDSHLIVYFVISGCWAFTDAVIQTQTLALYGVLFRSDEEAAFANYILFLSVGSATAFACSSLLCMTSKIYMVSGFLALGMIGYFSLEWRISKNKCFSSKPVS